MLQDVLDEPNPFGPVTPEGIDAFEKEIGWDLPEDFREYLLSHNGAGFKKDIFCFSNDPWDRAGLHHVHGLHDGPEWAQLRTNWRLYEFYDLQNWKWKLKKFLVFADTGTGDLFSINLKDGSVWFYEHDVEQRFLRVPGRLRKVEDSFSDFMLKLKTEDENNAELEGDPRYEEFKKRLAWAAAQRELDE